MTKSMRKNYFKFAGIVIVLFGILSMGLFIQGKSAPDINSRSSALCKNKYEDNNMD